MKMPGWGATPGPAIRKALVMTATTTLVFRVMTVAEVTIHLGAEDGDYEVVYRFAGSGVDVGADHDHDVASTVVMTDIQAALAVLPPFYRRILRLRYVEDGTTQYIAQVMPCERETVHHACEDAILVVYYTLGYRDPLNHCPAREWEEVSA